MFERIFRGRAAVTKEWVEGYHLKMLVGGKDVDMIFPHGAFDDMLLQKNIYQIDPETLGQGVGITDKNGKEIFEGDIVTGIAYSQKWIGTIIWIKEIASFGLYHGHEIAFENCSILKRAAKGMNDEFTAEIIGNIHDNPELLEE